MHFSQNVFLFLQITEQPEDGADGVKCVFYSKVEDSGWKPLTITHEIDIDCVVRILNPPEINRISKTRAWYIFKELEGVEFTESSFDSSSFESSF